MQSNKALLWIALLLIGIGALGLFLTGPWTGPINVFFNVGGLALAVISFFRDQSKASLPSATIPPPKPQPVRLLPLKTPWQERPSSRQEDNTPQPTSWSRNAIIVYAIIYLVFLAETIYYATTENISTIADLYSLLLAWPLVIVTNRLFPRLVLYSIGWISALVIGVLSGTIAVFIRDSFIPTPPLRWIIPPIVFGALLIILSFLWVKYQKRILDAISELVSGI